MIADFLHMSAGPIDVTSKTATSDLLFDGGISSLQKLETILKEIPAAIAILRGPDFVFEMANQAYLDLSGRTNIIGKAMLDVFPEIESQTFPKLLKKVLITGETYQAREVETLLNVRGPTGTPTKKLFLDFTYRRILDDQQEPYGVFVFAIDVTEKVLSRSRVQLEQVKLESVFANATAALAIVRGPEAIFEKVNTSYVNLFTDRPLIGRTLLEALPELSDQKYPDLIAKVYRTGERHIETEARAFLRRTTDGELEERFFDHSYTRISDSEGNPYGVLIHAQDVTERVRNREKLVQESEKNSRLLRDMPNPFFSMSHDWTMSYFNPAAEKTLGLKSSEVLGRSIWKIFPGLAESRFGEAYREAMTKQTRFVVEDYYPAFDRWYEAWAYPFADGLAVSFFDISDRKADEIRFRSEKEKFEAIFYGSASPLVFFCGPELVYEICNKQYQELVPNRELIGKPLLEALPELKGSAFPKLIKNVFDTGEPVVTDEELAPLVNAATGETENRYFDSAIARINDGEGKPYGVFVQATEVTDRVENRRRTAQALAARDTFLSIASHELRTPITGMKLQAQIMKRALAKNDPNALTLPRVKKLVDQTDEGLSRMNRLVEDMLEISRIQAGKLNLKQETTPIAMVIRDTLERFSEDLNAAGITVVNEALDESIQAYVDQFRFEQVLTNLITNAIKYAPGAPIQIQLTDDEHWIRLAFRDHGPGIAKDDREKIFDRFERLISANEVSGMGLGLFIVRQIVLAHGGRIFVDEDSRPGAKFVLELPRETGSIEVKAKSGPKS